MPTVAINDYQDKKIVTINFLSQEEARIAIADWFGVLPTLLAQKICSINFYGSKLNLVSLADLDDLFKSMDRLKDFKLSLSNSKLAIATQTTLNHIANNCPNNIEISLENNNFGASSSEQRKSVIAFIKQLSSKSKGISLSLCTLGGFNQAELMEVIESFCNSSSLESVDLSHNLLFKLVTEEGAPSDELVKLFSGHLKRINIRATGFLDNIGIEGWERLIDLMEQGKKLTHLNVSANNLENLFDGEDRERFFKLFERLFAIPSIEEINLKNHNFSAADLEELKKINKRNIRIIGLELKSQECQLLPKYNTIVNGNKTIPTISQPSLSTDRKLFNPPTIPTIK